MAMNGGGVFADFDLSRRAFVSRDVDAMGSWDFL